jgi:hypothetical protein
MPVEDPVNGSEVAAAATVVLSADEGAAHTTTVAAAVAGAAADPDAAGEAIVEAGAASGDRGELSLLPVVGDSLDVR